MPGRADTTKRAYAKVNLALAVGAAEPAGSSHPGWHPIASWVHSIDLFDEVRLTRRGDPGPASLEVRWAADAPRPSPVDWPRHRDLAARAHALLERCAGRALPVDIAVTKRIPVGGGLGGGSSDAAATLLALDELFGLGLGRDGLARESAALGSDVPYFVDAAPPRPAFVGGFGERVERGPRCAAGLVLIVPPFGCATPLVYRAYDGLGPGALDPGPVRSLALGGRLDPAALRNDLARAAEAVEPRLADLSRRAARAAGRPVHLSGSGSTLFVLGGPDAAARLRRELPECAIVPTRLV